MSDYRFSWWVPVHAVAALINVAFGLAFLQDVFDDGNIVYAARQEPATASAAFVLFCALWLSVSAISAVRATYVTLMLGEQP